MQRKPGFPAGNCSIKMPDNVHITMSEPAQPDEDTEQRRQQLINFAHAQWGFNNWSWAVTKQELDFVDFANGKFTAGVVAFVSINVKTFDIHRENIGYATTLANNKGFAIYKARKCAVTNALRETLLSFGANVATELMDLEPHKSEANITVPETENNQNIQNVPIKPSEPKNMVTIRKEAETKPANLRSPHPVQPIKNAVVNTAPPVKPGVPLPPPAPAPPRHGSNEPKPSEGQSDEEARAERRRRQRQAQEEFRQKQILKQKSGLDDKQELSRDGSLDTLLMNIPTQDIII